MVWCSLPVPPLRRRSIDCAIRPACVLASSALGPACRSSMVPHHSSHQRSKCRSVRGSRRCRSTCRRRAFPWYAPVPEQHDLPEVAHDRQVGREVHPRHVDEDRTEQVVGEGPAVEVGHQGGDVERGRRCRPCGPSFFTMPISIKWARGGRRELRRTRRAEPAPDPRHAPRGGRPDRRQGAGHRHRAARQHGPFPPRGAGRGGLRQQRARPAARSWTPTNGLPQRHAAGAVDRIPVPQPGAGGPARRPGRGRARRAGRPFLGCAAMSAPRRHRPAPIPSVSPPPGHWPSSPSWASSRSARPTPPRSTCTPARSWRSPGATPTWSAPCTAACSGRSSRRRRRAWPPS